MNTSVMDTYYQISFHEFLYFSNLRSHQLCKSAYKVEINFGYTISSLNNANMST